MKRNLLLFIFSLIATPFTVFGQCGDLFFSEYVEGYSNNKALEIYNPTQSSINLSGYSVIRFDNGVTDVTYPPNSQATIIQLPDAELKSGDVFVICIDRSSVTTETIYSQFDKPVWNGYMVVDTLYDNDTGEPLMDDEGNVITGVQYDDGTALFDLSSGATYYEQYDLQGKVDAFLCQNYNVNKTMSFNGNDAMALIKGAELADDFSNLIDVIGVIGEDPEVTMNQDSWINSEGYWILKDQTCVRNKDVQTGRIAPGLVSYAQGGTFTGEEWTQYRKNTFSFLGYHDCDCTPGGVGVSEINTIPIRLYPNPTNDMFIVETPKLIQRVEVYNTIGQKMNFPVQFHNNICTVKTQGQASGLYSVHVYMDDNDLSVKQVLLR